MNAVLNRRRISLIAAVGIAAFVATAGATRHAAAVGGLDLRLKAAGPLQVAPGAPIAYTLRLANVGTAPITSTIDLFVNLPDSLTDVSVEPAPGFSCYLFGQFGSVSIVACRYVPTLNPGEVAAQPLTVTAPTTPGSVTMSAQAHANTSQPDENPRDNEAAIVTSVQAPQPSTPLAPRRPLPGAVGGQLAGRLGRLLAKSDLQVEMTAPATIRIGQHLGCDLTVRNTGDADAQAVDVLINLPRELQLDLASVGIGGNCSVFVSIGSTTGSQQALCHAGDIAAGQSATLSVGGALPVGQRITATTLRASATVDPNNAIAESNESNNDSSKVITTVQ